MANKGLKESPTNKRRCCWPATFKLKGGSHPKVFPQIGQCNSSDTDILMCLTIQALGSEVYIVMQRFLICQKMQALWGEVQYTAFDQGKFG